MTNSKKLKSLLLLLLFSPLVVIALSRITNWPAEFAGASFVLIGFLIFGFTFKWPHFKFSMLFWLNIFYVFFGLFLLYFNLIHWGENLKTYTILGVPAILFHYLTELLYLAMIFLVSFNLYKLKTLKVIN